MTFESQIIENSLDIHFLHNVILPCNSNMNMVGWAMWETGHADMPLYEEGNKTQLLLNFDLEFLWEFIFLICVFTALSGIWGK